MIITGLIYSSGGSEVCLHTEAGNFTLTLADARRLGFEALNEEDFPIEFKDEQKLELLAQKLKAIKYCTYLLSFSDKSSSSLLKKLREKQYSTEVCTLAMDTLKENGIIDDYALCFRKLCALSREKLYGPYRLKSELLAKGFCIRDVQNALDDAEIDFDATLPELCEKLIRTSKVDFSDMSQVSKFKAKLSRYGYSFDAINTAIDKLLPEF